MFLNVFGVGVGALCWKKTHETVRNEKSKHRNHMAPNLSLEGGKKWPKMTSKWSLGASKWGQNDPKMEPWGTKKRMWKMITEKIVKKSFCTLWGVPFWSHFWSKIDAENGAEKRWVQNCVLDDFWSILGSLFVSFWWLLGPRRQKNGERVKMWKLAQRLSEKLTFEDSWGSKIDKKRPETENWTHVFRGTILDHSLGTF